MYKSNLTKLQMQVFFILSEKKIKSGLQQMIWQLKFFKPVTRPYA
jgi:hypothetical protein